MRFLPLGVAVALWGCVVDGGPASGLSPTAGKADGAASLLEACADWYSPPHCSAANDELVECLERGGETEFCERSAMDAAALSEASTARGPASPVVGGQEESGYLAAGFLLYGASPDTLRGPKCGVNVVESDPSRMPEGFTGSVAVTAAHCVLDPGGRELRASHFAVGFGPVFRSWRVRVAERDGVPWIVTHPAYNRQSLFRHFHDLAVLYLEEDVTERAPGLTPLPVATVSADSVQESNRRQVEAVPMSASPGAACTDGVCRVEAFDGEVDLVVDFEEPLTGAITVDWATERGDGFLSPVVEVRGALGGAALAQRIAGFDRRDQTIELSRPLQRLIFRVKAPPRNSASLTLFGIHRTISGCDARFLGYGRTTPGGSEVLGTRSRHRKSTSQCIYHVSALALSARGDTGGLCYGDSGGPLLVSDGTTWGEETGWSIVGVLADFALESERRGYCEVGNQMVFTSLSGEQAFLEPLGVRLVSPE